MERSDLTTPFGRRGLTLGQISSQVSARAARADAVVHKWRAFHHIREARERLGATDRGLAILNALLTFHPETALTGESELVVWPSNAQLTARANGMPATTLRRHLAVLVECGLIIRRDSPNGKRFARKSRDGEIEQAYGFDLSPIVARAEEFAALAEAVRGEQKAFRVARERLTLLRRDIVKMIGAGIEEGAPGEWGRAQETYRAILGRLPRAAARPIVEAIGAELGALRGQIREALESFAKTRNPNANESHSGRHIQNSNPDSSSESEQGSAIEQEAESEVRIRAGAEVATGTGAGAGAEIGAGARTGTDAAAGARAEARDAQPELGTGSGSETDAARPGRLKTLRQRELPLNLVLDACANLRDLARPAGPPGPPGLAGPAENGDIRDWRDFLDAAELARPLLAISPSAWRDARDVLGERQAAITLAAIHQRAGQINNPGGYLRHLTERARQGKFSTWPMVMALLRVRLEARKPARDPARDSDGRRGGDMTGATLIGAGSPWDGDVGAGRAGAPHSALHVSQALLNSLRRRPG
jgi:replication initiation protein RepC